jgi:hypothetical protein
MACIADFLGSRDSQVPNPIVGSWFRIEQGPLTAPPKYEYDEVGVVFEGEPPDVYVRERS